MLLAGPQGCDSAFFQGVAVVPAKRLLISHEAIGVQEEHLFVPEMQAGNPTKGEEGTQPV